MQITILVIIQPLLTGSLGALKHASMIKDPKHTLLLWDV